jgi:nucleoside 2-deoxyribosyltransferase
MLKVYLAGGMHSGWQDTFMKFYPSIDFIDPRAHELTAEGEYALADRLAIKQCDLMIAYFEKNNPSGLGLAFEIGYAIGLGIPIIFIDEKRDKYAGMLRGSANLIYFSMAETFAMLDGLVRGEIK